MNISNNLMAPCLLIIAMLVLILFQSVFFTNGDVIYSESEIKSELTSETTNSVDFIIYNNIKYKPDRFFILSVISNISAFLLPAVFYVKLKGTGYSKNLKLQLPKIKYISLTLFMFVVIISGSVLINSLMIYFGETAVDSVNMLPAVIYTGGNPVYDMGVIISFIFLPAFCEEIFFRSVMSAEYEKYGAFCAVMMTSAAFAMSHFSFKFFPSYFFAAFVLYILAKITNSVTLAVILHAGYNFFNIYLWDRLSGVLNFEQNRTIFIFITAIIFILFIYFVLNRLEIIYYNKAYMNEPSPILEDLPGNSRKSPKIIKLFKSLLSPTFIAAIIIFFIYINI